MSRKQFVALAEAIRKHNATAAPGEVFTPAQISSLADYAAAQNALFNRSRFLRYIEEGR